MKKHFARFFPAVVVFLLVLLVTGCPFIPPEDSSTEDTIPPAEIAHFQYTNTIIHS